jgi:hypothetical protein
MRFPRFSPVAGIDCTLEKGPVNWNYAAPTSLSAHSGARKGKCIFATPARSTAAGTCGEPAGTAGIHAIEMLENLVLPEPNDTIAAARELGSNGMSGRRPPLVSVQRRFAQCGEAVSR